VRRIHDIIQKLFIPTPSDKKIRFVFKQFTLYGYLQAISCVFPAIIFVSLAITSMLPDLGIHRYDLLLLICVLAQVIMYKRGWETRDELYVITFFHLLGLVMEFHKVHHGSWSYPEEGFTKIFGVPLYSGFMYASVGSYICQAWRNLQLSTENWPRSIFTIPVGVIIYVNFITNAFILDLRIYIAIVLMVVFFRTKFVFRLNGYSYKIPAILSFVLIGFFIWLAENIATYFGAWKYAYQHQGWQIVAWHKITSWSLLVIVSIIIVGELKKLKGNKLNY